MGNTFSEYEFLRKLRSSVAFPEIESDANLKHQAILLLNFPERSKATNGHGCLQCLLRERVLKIGQRTVAKRWS